MTDAGESFEDMSEEQKATKLASMGCSNPDIALLVGCSEKKLHSRYRKQLARARAGRRMQILEYQNAAAAKANAAILIWLGKTELDQVDKKPRPEPINDYLEAMDALGAEFDRATSQAPGTIEA